MADDKNGSVDTILSSYSNSDLKRKLNGLLAKFREADAKDANKKVVALGQLRTTAFRVGS